jgi:formylglycine-generating enzyme required for sulfatase activity
MLEWCEIPAGGVTVEGVRCTVPAFRIAKRPLTYGQYEAFVRDRGYDVRSHWTDAGWACKGGRGRPAYWGDRDWHSDDYPILC